MQCDVKFGVKKIEYPRLMIATRHNLIIMETRDCEGFVVSPGNTIFKIGEHITNFLTKSEWCVFDGDVTLRN